MLIVAVEETYNRISWKVILHPDLERGLHSKVSFSLKEREVQKKGGNE